MPGLVTSLLLLKIWVLFERSIVIVVSRIVVQMCETRAATTFEHVKSTKKTSKPMRFFLFSRALQYNQTIDFAEPF